MAFQVAAASDITPYNSMNEQFGLLIAYMKRQRTVYVYTVTETNDCHWNSFECHIMRPTYRVRSVSVCISGPVLFSALQ